MCGSSADVAMLLLGGAGSGKSSIMAKAAHSLLHKARQALIPWSVLTGTLVKILSIHV